MKHMLHRWRVPLTLAGLCAALFAHILEQSPATPPRHSLPPASGASDAALAPPLEQPAYALPPKAAFVVLAERPLFQPDRHPYVQPRSAPPPVQVAAPPSPPPAPPPAPPSLRNGFTLVGVVQLGKERIALLKPTAGQPTMSVLEGDTIQGWTVQSIGIDRILAKAGAVQEALEFPKPQPGMPRPVAPLHAAQPLLPASPHPPPMPAQRPR